MVQAGVRKLSGPWSPGKKNRFPVRGICAVSPETGIARMGTWFWRFVRFDAGAGLMVAGLVTFGQTFALMGSIATWKTVVLGSMGTCLTIAGTAILWTLLRDG
jgi:hypothetical protein